MKLFEYYFPYKMCYSYRLLLVVSWLGAFVNTYTWVPLFPKKSFVTTAGPRKLKLLNKEYVVWNHNDTIVVQDNICLHRCAPLSEGYIDDNSGCLRCSYHGWEFTKDGSLKTIPQEIQSNRKMSKSTSNNEPQRRPRLRTYNTACYGGLVWVNIGSTLENTKQLPQNVFHVNIDDACEDILMKDVPYSMTTLLENLFDPSHIPYAHHKLQSDRSMGSEVNSSLIYSNREGFSVLFSDRSVNKKQTRTGSLSFHAPFHYVLTSMYPYTDFTKLHVFCVPIDKDTTRLFVQQELRAGLFRDIYTRLPGWIKHSVTQTFFDSDTLLLHYQEAHLRSRNQGSMRNTTRFFCIPNYSDYSVELFHQWKREFPPEWVSLVESEIDLANVKEKSRNEILDREFTHTQYCDSCTNALVRIRRTKQLLPWITIFLFSVDIGFRSSVWVLQCGILYLILQYAETFFVYRNYRHHDV